MPTVVSGVTPQSGDAVFLIIGQSEHGFSGNVAQTVAATGALFFNMADGAFYTLADPLPGWGTVGNGGSIWSRFGHLYQSVPNKPWPRVIFVMAAIPGSSSGSWTPTGANFAPYAVGAYSAMVQRGFTPTAFLWGQGSKDNVAMVAGTVSTGQHTANVTAMVSGLRAAGITAPVIQARCCLCRQDTAANPAVALAPDFDACGQSDRLTRLNAEFQIQKEQAAIPAALASIGVRDGPNLDSISAGHRWDGNHMDSFGQEIAALLWLDVLLKYKQTGVI